MGKSGKRKMKEEKRNNIIYILLSSQMLFQDSWHICGTNVIGGGD